MIDGSILVGNQDRQSPASFTAVEAATGKAYGPAIGEAGTADVADACALAAAAFASFSGLPPASRAAFLEAVGEAILAIGDVLIETAMAETGLPRPRLEGERMRTVNQLRMFADELRRGHWLDVVIDRAQPSRVPPRSDLRRMNHGIGPVAVFGASNFPLAFSVAGGDTASALAAGCPVVVKGHPAHPGTGELVARAVRSAVQTSGLPEGVFSYLPGTSHDLGTALVSDPRIKAVGFTGSRSGGLALMAVAAARSEPIPVYAEMSSINPVVLCPAALERDAEALGASFIASLTLGAGQFCTNPGLVLAIESTALDRFAAAAGEAISGASAAVMLTPGIHDAFVSGVDAALAEPDLSAVARGSGSGERPACPALFQTTASAFVANPALSHELFGAASTIVRCADEAELVQVILHCEGQLTATIHMASDDEKFAAKILPLLAEKAGRVLANGWPTGVEVTRAMVHGGPYPATSDGRSTSVGTLAMTRFMRPVCYQDIPLDVLPPALHDSNPWGVPQSISD